MTPITRVTYATAIAIGCACTAHATPSTITMASQSLPPSDPYTGRTELSLPAFDETLGTLTTITIRVSATLTETMIVSGAGPGEFQIHEGFALGSQSYAPSPWTITAPIDRDARGNFQAHITASTETQWTPSGSAPGVVFYDLFASPIGLYSPGDGLHNISVAGSATTTYGYTPTTVPEPPAMTLLLSFLGIGLVAWAISAGPAPRRGMFQ